MKIIRVVYLMEKFILISVITSIIMMLSGVSDVWAADVKRPDADKATTIYIRMLMVDIDDVKDAEQKFSANFYYEAHWKDKRLVHANSNSVTYPTSQVWTPRLQLVNQQKVWKTFPEVVVVDKKGNVTYRQRVWGDFSQPLKLHQFPFDIQTFSISLAAAGYRPNEIKMEIYQGEISGIASELSLPDWAVLSWNMDNAPYKFFAERGGFDTPSMKFNVLAKRYIGYYILMYIFPLFLIVCMSWLTFWVGIKESNTRLNIAVTSMLTLIAYRFIMGSTLPEVSYLTRLDLIMLASTLLVFTALILTALISSLINQGKFGLANKVDLYSRWLMPVILIVVMIGPTVM